MPVRLAIFETHPIQYKIPWFRALHERPEVDVAVFYAMMPSNTQQGAGFGVSFEWDVPLLDGYNHVLLENTSRHPDVTRFSGCDTPGIYRYLDTHVPAFDAAIINGWVAKSCLQALWACRRAGIPAILRCEANNMRDRAWWKTLVHKRMLKQFKAFIAIGSSNREFYTQRGVSPHSIYDGFYCIDDARFAKASKQFRSDRPSIRSHWHIAPDAVCFLFCGKFEAKKRPMDLLKALAAVATAAPTHARPPHLLMVGDGDLRRTCESYALQHNLSVTFTGFLNQMEMPKAYTASDCLVLPSDYGETWGLVVNEAMACALPAIVSDHVGCHPDLIQPGKTGDLFPFGDIDKLAATMRKYVLNPQNLPAMGQQAHRLIQQYSIDNLTRGTLEAVSAATKTRS